MEIRGLRKPVLTVEPYSAGKSIEEVKRELGLTDVIKIASNENNYAPFPRVLKAMERELLNLNRYTDITFKEIKELLGNLYGVAPQSIAVAHGTESMFQTLVRSFIEYGDEILMPSVTYGLYKEISKLMGGMVIQTPMNDYTSDLKAMVKAITSRTKLVWLANPNNPTGTIFPKEHLSELLDALPEQAWVILDEAYAEFAEADDLPEWPRLIHGERNVIVTRTFSKAYGLAGARLGYAAAHPDMITVIDTVSEPFNANRIGLAGAISVLTEAQEEYRAALTNIVRDRQRVSEVLRELGMQVVPSSTNFIFFETPYNAQQLAWELLQKGIIVRPCVFWGHPNALRVTIGTSEQMDRFLFEFQDVLKNLGATAVNGHEHVHFQDHERLEI